jgi:hypothetical protein
MLSASFLADLQEDYELYGKGIFALMRERFQVLRRSSIFGEGASDRG